MSIANYQGEIALIQIISDMNLVDYLLTREKLNDSIRATRVREGCLLWEFRAAIEVNLIKIPYRLTAKTIHIHIFYFAQSILFSAQNEKKWLDS